MTISRYKTPYKILNLSISASNDQIVNAYKSKLHHIKSNPNLNGHKDKVVAKVNNAYTFLLNHKKRAIIDAYRTYLILTANPNTKPLKINELVKLWSKLHKQNEFNNIDFFKFTKEDLQWYKELYFSHYFRKVLEKYTNSVRYTYKPFNFLPLILAVLFLGLSFYSLIFVLLSFIVLAIFLSRNFIYLFKKPRERKLKVVDKWIEFKLGSNTPVYYVKTEPISKNNSRTWYFNVKANQFFNFDKNQVLRAKVFEKKKLIVKIE